MASSTNTTPSQSPNLGSGSASSLPNVNIAPSGSQPAGTSAQPSVAPSPSNIIRQKQGEQAFQRVDKVNGELLALTYGALVSQVIRDLDGNPEEINAQLEKMGYNIGLRLVEELLARTGIGRCKDFVDTAEVLAKVGLKMFLGVAGNVVGWNADKRECSIILDENPLAEFVELPEQFAGKLSYSIIICGVIRGALEMLQMRVECKFVRDVLFGHDTNEIRLTLKEILTDEKYAITPGN